MRFEGDGVEAVDVPVTGLTREAWAELVDAHPPRPKSSDRAWNEDTFPPALIAACTGAAPHSAALWWDEAPEGDAWDLFEECLRKSTPGSVEWAVARLRRNPRRRAEVEAAVRLGIPPSEFLRWPNRDQDLVIALAELEADVCPGCGVPNAERENVAAYTTKLVRCVHCKQEHEARADIPDDSRAFVRAKLVPNEGAAR